MKIAVAMLCHKNVQQINSLLQAMGNDSISFFYSCRQKSEINREEILETISRFFQRILVLIFSGADSE